jgi:hypothetical protein
MKTKRVITGLLVFLLCGIFFENTALASGPENFLIRTYRIEVAVECLDEALPRIMTLPGIDLQSTLDFSAGSGRMQRLVNNAELDAALSILRGLGNVSATSSQARNEFAQYNGLQSEFRIRSIEYVNLNELLHQAQTLTDFRIIESRLVTLISEIESLRGRINFLNSEMGTTLIHITITTIPIEPEEIEIEIEEVVIEIEEPEPIAPTAFQNIGNAFTRSADATLEIVQAVAIFFAHISIPLVAVLIIAFIVLRIVRKKKMKNKSLVLLLVLIFFASCSRNDNSDIEIWNDSPRANNVQDTASGDSVAYESLYEAEAMDGYGGWAVPQAEDEAEAPSELWQPPPMPAPPQSAPASTWTTPEIPQPVAVERRVIRNSDITIDTLTFEETVSNLERIVAINGGFIETSSQRLASLWTAEFTIRVPVARFDATNRDITGLGQIARFTTNSEDVTMLFLDLQSRLAIREEEERRVEAMRDAATDLRDLLTLERELSDLRVIVDRYRRRMTEIDALASFSTIRLTLREIVEIIEDEIEEEEEEEETVPVLPEETPADTFGTRIANAFGASARFSALLFEGIAIVIASSILPLSLVAVIAFFVYIFIKKKFLQKILG